MTSSPFDPEPKLTARNAQRHDAPIPDPTSFIDPNNGYGIIHKYGVYGNVDLLGQSIGAMGLFVIILINFATLSLHAAAFVSFLNYEAMTRPFTHIYIYIYIL